MTRLDWTRWMLPLPRGMESAEGQMPLDAATQIVLAPQTAPLVRKAAEQLRDDLKARRGIELRIVPPAEAAEAGFIAIGHPSENPCVRAVLDKSPAPDRRIGNLTAVEPPAEGYLLRTAGAACAVAGADDAGARHGVQTLRQILRGTAGAAIPGVRIWDWPCFPVRAMHMMCPRRSNLAQCEHMVEALALWKLNVLVLSFEYVPNFPFVGFESLNDPAETLTREEHAAFGEKCRRLGLQVVPLVPSFSHLQGFIFKAADWDDILEKPEDPSADVRRYYHPRGNYCPSNPRTYSIFFDLFDQVLDAYPSRWLHIGHDELDDAPVGVCAACRGVALWQLLAEDLWKIHDRMTVKRGVRLMMWPDMIIPCFRGGPRTGSKNIHPHMFMHFAVDRLPRDIIMTDWEYERRTYYLRPDEAPEGSYPSLRYLKDQGFTVLPFGWNEPRSIMLFAQAAWKESSLGWFPPGRGGPLPALERSGGEVIGYAGCTWGQVGPDMQKVAQGHPVTAAFAWNPHQTLAEAPDDPFRFLLDAMDWTG